MIEIVEFKGSLEEASRDISEFQKENIAYNVYPIGAQKLCEDYYLVFVAKADK